MSYSLFGFFFNFIQSAYSDRRLLSLQGLLALSPRGAEFGGSSHPFVLGLIDFLDNSPDDLADAIRALTGRGSGRNYLSAEIARVDFANGRARVLVKDSVLVAMT
jgi:hypothetical protein